MTRPWRRHYEPGVPEEVSCPALTLPEMLTATARKFPGRPAIRFFGRTLTYREVDALATRVANGLIACGVVRGQAVALMLPNLPQAVIGFFGALRAGAAVTPINPLYVEAEIERQMTDAGAQTVIALDQFVGRLEPLLERGVIRRAILTGVPEYLPWLKRVLYPLRAFRQPQTRHMPTARGAVRWGDLIRASGAAPPVSVSPDQAAILQYTGGTTGVPKGVILTHRNLVCNAWQCKSWMPSLREGKEVFLLVLPLFHVYGLSAGQNLAVSIGASMVLLPRFQSTEVLQAVTREQVTVFPGIPAMYAAINGYENLARFDLRSIRVCISGAGPLLSNIQERFEAVTGASIVEGYGLTEAGPVTHINPLHVVPEKRRRRSIGVPISSTDARIMDADTGTQEVPVGTVGELVVRGPQVMQGYWNRPDETAAVLRGGWLYTGDLARQDADGFFYIEDRKKDMIKSGGENVYPREVEDVLCHHPMVKEAVVVGIPLGLRGELIKAYVVLHPGNPVKPAELLEHCRRQLAKFKVPKRVEFRTELPKTLVGKVLRRVLVEEELKKRDQGDGREGGPDEITGRRRTDPP